MSPDINKILSIIGPTGTGKTGFVCQMAHKEPFEVISLDSAMVYSELSIAANKPSSEELALCPHHVINCTSVTQSFDVAKFFDLAAKTIEDVISRKKIPVIVGGTMMYAHVLQEGLTQSPSMPPQDKQAFLDHWAQKPIEEAYACLSEIDPLSAGKLNRRDSQRILRALEIATLLPTAQQRQEWSAKGPVKFPYSIQWIGIRVDSVEEHRKILQMRIDRMIAAGMIAEIEDLYSRFGAQDYGFWRFVAYRQYRQYFSGEIGLEEARERTGFATHQLAKHQRTWMNTLNPQRVKIACSLSPQSPEIEKILEEYAQSFKFC